MTQRQPASVRLLPLLEAVWAQERSEFTGLLRIILPGEEARLYFRAGEPRLCAGAATHYSLGAWLLRSESVSSSDLKALTERASAEGVRLEELLVREGRFSPEKLRAAQDAMSHFTFADLAVRAEFTLEPRPGDPPRIVDNFRLDPVRAILEYTARWEREPPRVLGSFIRGPNFDERRTAMERVFTGIGENIMQRLEQGPVTPPTPPDAPQRGGVVVGAASPMHRTLLGAVRVGAAALVPVRVEAPDASAPSRPEAGPSVLVGPRVAAFELSGLAARLAEEGLAPRPVVAPARATVVRSSLPPSAPPPPLAELPPLQATPPPSGEDDLTEALERAVRAAAESEIDEGEVFGVHIEDSKAPRAKPAERAPTTTAPSIRQSGATSRPPAETPRPAVEARPSGVVVRSSAPRTRPSGGQGAVAALLPPAPPRPLNPQYAALADFRELLARAGPLEALGQPPGALLSSLKESFVTLRSRFDPANFGEGGPGVAAMARDVTEALERAYSDLTSRETRAAIEAATGGLSSLELSSYFAADGLYREGRRAHAARDHRAAYSAFQRASQRYRREPEYAMWAAQALWDLSQQENGGAVSDVAFDSIQRHLDEALEVAPSYQAALLLFARLELERGRPNEALARYQTVLEFNPANVEAKAAVKELAEYAQPVSNTGKILGSLAARLVQGFKKGEG